jgi:hypothetical protein
VIVPLLFEFHILAFAVPDKFSEIVHWAGTPILKSFFKDTGWCVIDLCIITGKHEAVCGAWCEQAHGLRVSLGHVVGASPGRSV